jgi:hypothetical protein
MGFEPSVSPGEWMVTMPVTILPIVNIVVLFV